ncbi:LamG-like jellyroll fold domain-containing protein [Mucilaginibacter dorajii]|uniref:BIG2 domain-containing protein n=1 Tax=Mucilaginibacter dorajii TaxID=692994 RepID=A0ABP7R3U4_9SPHI|nr:LamG-like jellyroll fold domain-containing protein [Mucilaginibacter dorajii]MCS3737890.1 hypothetical protein [Mucilaginibacter dorajii]
MNKYYSLFVALAALVYCSCNKIADPSPDTLQSISLRDTLTLYTGNVVSLDIQVKPASFDTTKFIWGSSDTSVIAVTNRGQITAKNPGTSVVSVSNADKTKSVSCAVTVKDSLSIGLIAYYPFNNSAIDATGHGYNGIGTDLTSAADRFGKPNSAYGFNGTSSYIVVQDKQVLRLNNTDFTLNMWMNLDGYNSSSGSALLAKGNGPYQNGWNCSVTGLGTTNTGIGNAFYNVSGGDDPHAFGNTVIGLGKWTMVTITYNLAQQQISFYINGVFDHATGGIPTPNPNTAVNLFIGKNSYIDPSGLTPAYYIKGKMDDIRIYNHIIPSHEITKLYKLSY